MTYLKNKVCYLSGPIEMCDGNVSWRDEAKKMLRKFEIEVFDPFMDPKQQKTTVIKAARDSKDYEEIRKIAKGFVRKDLHMVDKSDMLLAYIPFKVPTTGTTHEIINANDRKKPVMLVCPEGKEFVSLWHYGYIHHKFMFSSFEEVGDYLRGVDLNLPDSRDDLWDVIHGRV